MAISNCGKVVVAMSGGVDSSVTAWLLQEQGYEVVGLFMRTGTEADNASGPGRRRGCCSAADAADARAIAARLGISLYVLNFKDQFEALIQHFADEYARGRTPNPCIVCNERLKFGRLAQYGEAIGAHHVATGHHARIVRRGGRAALARGRDADKDQSYVLFSVRRPMLDRMLLPVGELTKQEVRRHARQLDLPVHDKPDSQEICFVPDDDYARVVRQRRPDAFHSGPIRHIDGRELGRHEGLAHYTIGQRRGLRIALGAPVYVTQLDTETNTVVLGPREALLHDGLTATGVNWLLDPPVGKLAVRAKIRYAHAAVGAALEPIGSERIRLIFETAQPAITPGQAVVLYVDDVVLGGGWIDGWFDS